MTKASERSTVSAAQPGRNRRLIGRPGFRRRGLALAAACLAAAVSTGCEMRPEPRAASRPASPASPAAAIAAHSAPAAERFTPAHVAALARELEGIRGLKFKREVPARFMTAAQLRPRLTALFDREYPPEKLAREAGLLKALGVIPRDADLRALYLKLLGAQVAGLYDPIAGELIVVTDAAFGEADNALAGLGGALDPLDIVLIHELDHALSDQHYGLDRLGKSAAGRDGEAALQCLLEGEATLLMIQYALRKAAAGTGVDDAELLEMVAGNLDPAALAGLNQADPTLSGLPPFLVERLEAPYVDGFHYALGLWREGGWGAIEKALAAPPAASREVLHPDLRGTAAAPLAWLPAETGAAVSEEGPLGALETRLVLRAWGAPDPAAWVRGGLDCRYRLLERAGAARVELQCAAGSTERDDLRALMRKHLRGATITTPDARRVRATIPL